MNGEIRQTTDYTIFRKMVGNRAVDEKRVRGLMKSIKQIGWISNPIIVNERMEVIDGQGRLEALRRLEMPVEYRVIEGLNALNVCRTMNTFNVSWKTVDYVDSYADSGISDYQRVRQLMMMYKVPLETLMLSVKCEASGKKYEQIKNGGLVFDSKDYETAIRKMEIYSRYYPAFKNIGGQRRTKEKVIFFLIDYADKHPFDHDKMISVIASADPYSMHAQNFDRLLESVQDAWNFGRKKNKMYFYEEYRLETKLQ